MLTSLLISGLEHMKMKRKGIILAGGAGTRLRPITTAVSKQLLPIYDKPMIYYPLSTLMLAGIYEILVITTPHDISSFEKLLGRGNKWGLNIKYAIQENPDGLAQALLIGEKFLDGHPSALILGDNLFFGNELQSLLLKAQNKSKGASIFTHHVSDPERYGVAELNDLGAVINIQEKPKISKSSLAVTGLYFYDERAPEFASSLKPSKRGELEITDLNRKYIENNLLENFTMGRGFNWFDAGTYDSLLEASMFIKTIQKRQGFRISCLEEISFRSGLISSKDLVEISSEYGSSELATYLISIAKEKKYENNAD